MVDQVRELGSPPVLAARLRARLTGASPLSMHLWGPAGIGKSHLLSELTDFRTSARIVAHPEESTIAYAGLHQLSPWLQQALPALPAIQAEALAGALALAAPSAPDLPVLAATHQALTRLAEAGGAVLLIDDADQLDPATRAALEFTRRRLDRDNLRFITASRYADAGLAPDLVAEVTALNEDETGEILRGEYPDLHRGVADWVWQHSLGLPLAATAICRALSPEQRTGAQRLPDTPDGVRPLQELAAPTLRQASLPARLLLAAVSWERLTGTDGQRLLATLGIADGAPALAELSRLRLVAWEGQCLALSHPTLAAAAREQLDPTELEQVHRSLLLVLGDRPEVAARHQLALVRLGVDCTDAALQSLTETATAAAAGGAWAEAALAWEQGAELCATNRPAESMQWLAQAGSAALRAHAGPTCRRIITRMGESSPNAEREHAELWWTAQMYLTGPDGLPDTDAGERGAYALLDQPERAVKMIHTCAIGVAQTGRFFDAHRLLDRFTGRTGLQASDGRDRLIADSIAVVCGRSGAGAVMNGPWWDGLSTADLVDPIGFYLPLSGLLAWVGDRGAAVSAVRHQLQVIERGGIVGAVPFVACNQGLLARYDDDFVTAGSHYARVDEISVATGFGAVAPFAAGRHAHLLAEAGDLAGAEALIARAFPGDTADRIPAHAFVIGVTRAMIEAGHGRPHQALDQLVTVLAAARTHGMIHPRLISWVSLASELVAVHQTRADYADQLAALREAIAAAFDSGDEIIAAVAPRSRALLAAESEREAAWSDAARAAREGTSAYELARVLLAQGQWLRRERQRGAALAPLGQAWDLFADLALPHWQQVAGRELRACGRRLPATETVGLLTRLTPRELDVAREIATGTSNAEIAQRLFISRRTVEFHVGAIFRKLDVANRDAVAAHLHTGAPHGYRSPIAQP